MLKLNVTPFRDLVKYYVQSYYLLNNNCERLFSKLFPDFSEIAIDIILVTNFWCIMDEGKISISVVLRLVLRLRINQMKFYKLCLISYLVLMIVWLNTFFHLPSWFLPLASLQALFAQWHVKCECIVLLQDNPKRDTLPFHR